MEIISRINLLSKKKVKHILLSFSKNLLFTHQTISLETKIKNSSPCIVWHRPTMSNHQLYLALEKAIGTPSPQHTHPRLQFEWSTQAAQQNAAILQQHGWDLTRALDAEHGTILSPGSEFRDPNYLSPLWKSHRLWPKVHKWITEGITYPLILQI